MHDRDLFARRKLLHSTAWFAAGAGLWLERLFRSFAVADEPTAKADDSPIGRREILRGLDGMSFVADQGQTFIGGHNAAAVISSAFFCRREKLDAATQQELLKHVARRLLAHPIYQQPRPEEKAEPELVDALIRELDAGIGRLRNSGHNIIFAVSSLKALREMPEAATPQRIEGLRRMIRSFGTDSGSSAARSDKSTLVDLSDEPRFIRFVFEEYLKAMELYLNGKGHHGFAGHVLTIGHALVELCRMGYAETAHKGVEAYWQFVEQARRGADLGGKKVGETPPHPPTPLERQYWDAQNKRSVGAIPSCHLIKYPYSFYDLARDLRDEEIRQKIFEKLYHLTAIS